jgi:transcriptional regulator with XRE-family HTH domain
MALREWRERNGKSQQDVARLVGAANATVVSRWERGVHLPRKDEMVRLYVLTRGEVPPNSFYDLPDLASLLADPAPGAQAAA